MEKQVVNMSNWELNIYDGEFNLEGVGDYHPRLGKDAYISYTTKVEKCYLEDDVLRKHIYAFVNDYSLSIEPIKQKLLENLQKCTTV